MVPVLTGCASASHAHGLRYFGLMAALRKYKAFSSAICFAFKLVVEASAILVIVSQRHRALTLQTVKRDQGNTDL